MKKELQVENIVFLQGQDADEAMQIYYDEGIDALFKFLEQWHYPGEHEIRSDLGAGGEDSTYNIDNYVLTVNTRLNYCGLEYVLNNGGK